MLHPDRSDKKDAISQYMHYRQLSPELQDRMRNYYSFLWSRQSVFDEASILSELPTHLRRDVALSVNKGVIGRVPFFQVNVFHISPRLFRARHTPHPRLACRIWKTHFWPSLSFR
jgi:hypothetical protein